MWKNASEYRLPAALKGTILEQIVNAKVQELIGIKDKLPAVALEAVLDRVPEIRSIRSALMSHAPAVIAEIKRASPSAGLIRGDFDPAKIAKEYSTSGAAALSVLTEARHFRGSLEILARLRWSVKIPLLRKDFIVDPYQILEARHAGADAVLLIAALLDTDALQRLRSEAERLGMEALIEVHNEEELRRALDAGAALIGVNNRDLRTFEVSLDVSLNLARRMPDRVLAVAESGIRSAADVRRLADAGYRGFLIGEQFMRAPSPGMELAKMIRDSKCETRD
ncbi:MAG TPA: indole-3-glycerol phosphate synthase TrpC [Acidobacteriota bacterium]|nr:indole-3-glycerol phosphate synthase TrpC [Acidobacteriota bacterium]